MISSFPVHPMDGVAGAVLPRFEIRPGRDRIPSAREAIEADILQVP